MNAINWNLKRKRKVDSFLISGPIVGIRLWIATCKEKKCWLKKERINALVK